MEYTKRTPKQKKKKKKKKKEKKRKVTSNPQLLASMVDLHQIRYLQNIIHYWGSFGFEGYLS